MDPDMLLDHLLAWARLNDSTKQRDEAVLAVNVILDLHEWISRGGHLPRPWRRKNSYTPMPGPAIEGTVLDGIWDD